MSEEEYDQLGKSLSGAKEEAMTEAQPMLSVAERLTLIQTLNALPGPQFDQLVFALNPPSGNIPRSSASQSDRSVALLQWIESPVGPGLSELVTVLTSLMGSNNTIVLPLSAPQQQTVEVLRDIVLTMSQNQAPKYDMRGSQFAGGFAETVQGDQRGGTFRQEAQHEQQ